ncbi:MAG: hypothetical protein LBP67_02880 [Bacteroidales bacterium]|jgi:hypothetical protein|nr:hypothetical protein [Bacteroidales bacterium]
MKRIKFLGALIVMLFISTNVFSQTIPAYTYVQTAPSAETINDETTIHIEWVGTDGHKVISPTLITTITDLSGGVYVPSWLFAISINFYPVVETRVIVKYVNEKHIGVYPGLATSLIRALHPSYWTIYY